MPKRKRVEETKKTTKKKRRVVNKARRKNMNKNRKDRKKKTTKNPTSKSARDFIATLPWETWLFFCDGSATTNPGPCGAGMVGCLPFGVAEEIKPTRMARMAKITGTNVPELGEWIERRKHLGQGTNNIGELEGIGLVLNEVALRLENNRFTNKPIVYILTDSVYSINILTKPNWKPKKNQELVLNLQEQLKKLMPVVNIHFHWVKGHAGLPGNERADKLAQEACELINTISISPG